MSLRERAEQKAWELYHNMPPHITNKTDPLVKKAIQLQRTPHRLKAEAWLKKQVTSNKIISKATSIIPKKHAPLKKKVYKTSKTPKKR